MPILLEMNDVSKAIDGRLGLNRVPLSLQSGEALDVLSPNGAGKSTILNRMPDD